MPTTNHPTLQQPLTALLAQQVAHANSLAVQVGTSGMHDSDYDFLGGALDASAALLELAYGNSPYSSLHEWATVADAPQGREHQPPLSQLAMPDCLCPALWSLACSNGLANAS